LLFFCFFSVFSTPLDSEWLALLRYNKYANTYQSEADDQRFFLTTNGKNDPVAEYDALVDQLTSDITNDDHVACRFPARTLKLLRDGSIKKVPNFSKCKKLQQYLRATQAKGASLVFAGYFIQRPSSAFGHTFLRLHTNQLGNAALLDFAVDFAASVDTSIQLPMGLRELSAVFLVALVACHIF